MDHARIRLKARSRSDRRGQRKHKRLSRQAGGNRRHTHPTHTVDDEAIGTIAISRLVDLRKKKPYTHELRIGETEQTRPEIQVELA